MLRHAAALALTGWYLMAPPYLPSRTKPPPPLNQWRPLKQFDDLTQCKKELAKPIVVELANLSPLVGPGAFNHWAMAAIPIKYRQCIAADDPRLKGE